MKYLDIIITLVAPLSTLGGVYLGNILTRKNQQILYREQRRSEENDITRENYAKTMSIYNEFLEKDGRISIIGSVDDMQFKYDIYREQIRPIFYQDISLLHDNVIEKIIEIDKEISNRDFFYEGSSYVNEDIIIKLYSDVYLAIIEYVKEGYSAFKTKND